jgi:predicted DNA-binding transcriptional regulator AlpA
MSAEKHQLVEFGIVPRRTGQPACLLTLDQVSEMLSVSKAWVRDHATRRNPRIPVVRLGGKRAVLRFRAQDIEQFIAQHLVLEDRV